MKNLKAPVGLKSSKKPLSVSRLKKEADKWHSLATRLRFADGDGLVSCVTCTNPQPKHYKLMQCGHFMSRQFLGTRYDPENTAPQCYGCNVMQQGKQYEFGLWIDSFYGDGTAKKLYDQAKAYNKLRPDDYLEIIAEAKAEIKAYGIY